MKHWYLSLILFFVSLANGFAAPRGIEPETILPITKVSFDFPYYEEQAALWQQKTSEDANNASAWLNYYRAARYANLLSDSLSSKYDLDAIVSSMPAALSQTFEFNYILYLQDNWSDERFGHLLKAHELAPERLEAYHDLITYGVTTGNWEDVKNYSEKLFAAGEYPPSILAWNYNALNSVEKNAILLTHGDNDTYPAWVVQYVKNVRPDVKVLNVNLLMYDTYRDRVFNELDIAPVASSDHPDYKDFYLAITQQIMHQSQRPVYLSTSIPKYIRQALSDSLYLVGLAFKYSPTPFDNVATLKFNYEKRFLKDQLHIQLEADTGSNVTANMNLHYLPAIILLHRNYLASGDDSKARELAPILRQIAAEAGREDIANLYLGYEKDASEKFVSTISVRNLDKAIKKVGGKLYAFETEVTNEQYEAFLMDLVKNKEFDLLEKCKAPKTDWRKLLPAQYIDLPDSEIFANGHPDDPNAPVQNISFEAAQEYCKWITKVYNASTDKKKTYNRIVFRLPSEQEWEQAAHGNQTSPYPWGGYFYRNAKGCFLFNTQVAQERPCDDCPDAGKTKSRDGGFFPVPADSYFPNDLGLYNTSGNVAEMISVKGIAKGGSWEDHPDDSKIISRKKYDSPSPAIGFRVFMEGE